MIVEQIQFIDKEFISRLNIIINILFDLTQIFTHNLFPHNINQGFPITYIIIMIMGSILPFQMVHLEKALPYQISAFRQAHCFCESKQEQSIDELKNDQKYLTKFNESIRKPHEKQQKQQQRLIETYLAQKRYPQIVSFLVRNTGNTLCSTTSTSKIYADLAVNWLNLSKRDQNQAAYALIYFRQAKVFEIFKKQVEAGIKLKGVQGFQCEELIVFLCGELINRKSLRFISKLYPKTTQRFQIFDKIYKFIDTKNYKGMRTLENNLLNYIRLMLDPPLNKKQETFNKDSDLLYKSLSNLSLVYYRLNMRGK